MNVLITVPRMNKSGGVTNYFKVLDKYLDVKKKYFEIGSLSSNESKIMLLFRITSDYIRFIKEILFGGYDVIHINPSLLAQSIIREGILILLCRIRKIPVVIFIHGWDKNCEFKIKRNYKRIFKYVYGKASAIIVLAEEFKFSLIDIGLKNPVYILTTLVDDDIFNIDLSKDKYTTSCNILFLSRIEKEKGVYEAINACSLLRKQFPNMILYIAGDGSESSNVKDYIYKNNIEYIKLLGLVKGKEKEELFKHSDLYIFPTNYGEGMPTTVLEAMAYGLPVITRPVGGLKDFFEDKNMGFITNSLDPVDYSNLMKKLLDNDDLRFKISKYHKTFAMNNFSATIIADKILGIYNNAYDKY